MNSVFISSATSHLMEWREEKQKESHSICIICHSPHPPHSLPFKTVSVSMHASDSFLIIYLNPPDGEFRKNTVWLDLHGHR
jgi:hypothetical protein